MGKVITVFGGTGWLGRIVVQRLANRGASIVIPFRCDEADLGPLRVMGDLGKLHFKRFDIRDRKEELLKLVEHSDAVINLCSLRKDGWWHKMDEVNIQFSMKLASLIPEDKRYIHLSCLEALNYLKKNADPFFRSKYFSEIAVANERKNSIIIRTSRLFGIDDSFINALAQQSYPLKGEDVKVSFAPLHVNDCSEGIIRIALEDFPPLHKRKYNPLLWELEGPQRFSVLEIQNMVNDAIMSTIAPNEKKPKYTLYDEPGASDENGLFKDIGVGIDVSNDISREADSTTTIDRKLITLEEGLLEIIRPYRSKKNWNFPLKI